MYILCQAKIMPDSAQSGTRVKEKHEFAIPTNFLRQAVKFIHVDVMWLIDDLMFR